VASRASGSSGFHIRAGVRDEETVESGKAGYDTRRIGVIERVLLLTSDS
jgi:hypothetical protein